MDKRRVDITRLTRVEYSFGKFTILVKSDFDRPTEDVVLQYYRPSNGVPIQIDMSRDDLCDLLALLTKMQLAGEINFPTDYVTD